MLVAKGLEGVVANESRLSEVDGENGTLCYLGYTIDDLVAHCSFEEVMFLLFKSKLPNQVELDTFTAHLRAQRELPDVVVKFLRTCVPSDGNVMDILRTAVSLLGRADAAMYEVKRTRSGRADSIALQQPRDPRDLPESVFQHPRDFVARLARVRCTLRRDRAIDGVTQCAQSLDLVFGEDFLRERHAAPV